ncbi:MAG: YqeG family HAD IIIA-type phosphatase [Mycoplasmataceae bacterium]|nr:YqeG family HAD IIIA-type phosphatase [Mycoplasmataceae bacterium]
MQKYKRKSNWLNYFRPTIFIKSFNDINIFSLKKIGIKMIICDLDNTLAPHFSRLPTKRVIDFCKKIRDHGIKLVIVSNNNKKRVNAYVSKLQIDGAIASAKKPLKRKIVKLMNQYNMQPNEVIFIGDQFITDIWVANRIGSKSVLVLPLIEQSSDQSSNWIIRLLDRFVYKKLEHGNFLHLDYARGGVLGDEYQII